MRALIWFHRDLRTHDHAGLSWAREVGCEVTTVVLSPRSASQHKLNFWHQSVTQFSGQLNELGITLELAQGEAHIVIPELVRQKQIDIIITHERMNFIDEQELQKVSNHIKVPMKVLGELTLYPSSLVNDLTITQLKPFTAFKNRLQRDYHVPIEQNKTLESCKSTTSALARLQHYVWDSKACLHYHQTRNGMLAEDDSSKWSPHLALGTLSPRRIYFELQKFTGIHGPSQGVDALIYELIWRDYFKFLAKLQGASLFQREGLRSTVSFSPQDPNLFESWQRGETGEDFVDANMRELWLTGWMSNRGRQNVASYLAKTMRLDWTEGARWFAEHLIDEDPENNWGNWQYLAGVGTDPRDRIFNVQKQAEDYDPKQEYRQRWLGGSDEIAERILALLSTRSPQATICPSEVLAKEVKQDKVAMEEVRSTARRLYSQGLVCFTQKGIEVSPYEARGPVRLKKIQTKTKVIE